MNAPHSTMICMPGRVASMICAGICSSPPRYKSSSGVNAISRATSVMSRLRQIMKRHNKRKDWRSRDKALLVASSMMMGVSMRICSVNSKPNAANCVSESGLRLMTPWMMGLSMVISHHAKASGSQKTSTLRWLTAIASPAADNWRIVKQSTPQSYAQGCGIAQAGWLGYHRRGLLMHGRKQF